MNPPGPRLPLCLSKLNGAYGRAVISLSPLASRGRLSDAELSDATTHVTGRFEVLRRRRLCTACCCGRSASPKCNVSGSTYNGTKGVKREGRSLVKPTLKYAIQITKRIKNMTSTRAYLDGSIAGSARRGRPCNMWFRSLHLAHGSLHLLRLDNYRRWRRHNFHIQINLISIAHDRQGLHVTV